VAGAAVPGGAIATELGGRGAWPWLVLLAASRWVTADRVRGREAARRGGWALVLLVWAPVGMEWLRWDRGGEGQLSLFFLDVGQGDAAVLRTPSGEWVLVDAGPHDARGDAGRRTVAPFLVGRGARRLSILVVSHAHADHLGGAVSVLERLPVGAVIEPARLSHDSLYLGFLERLEAGGTAWLEGRAGDRWDLDGVRFRVLHPDARWAGWGEDLNEDSLVLMVEYGGFRAVLAGDAGLPVEGRLAGRVGPVDVLKAGHHGSRTATGGGWLGELTPRAVILSVGVNRYGHPTAETVERIRASGASLWRTDRDGTVTVRTDGCRVAIGGNRRTEQYRIGRAPCRDGPQ
jgi:competence protein ComEC